MKYLVFDLEMTGGDPGWHDIIQIGACLYDHNWNEMGRFLENVYPENEEAFSLPSYEIHGLSKELLDEAPMLHEVLDKFEDWLVTTIAGRKRVQEFEKEKFLRQIKLCGQGMSGDIAFIKEAYRKEQKKWNFQYTFLDLQQLSFFLFKILRQAGYNTPRSLGLKAITEFFDLERETDLHNALEDAVLTGECLKRVMAYIPKLQLIEDEEED